MDKIPPPTVSLATLRGWNLFPIPNVIIANNLAIGDALLLQLDLNHPKDRYAIRCYSGTTPVCYVSRVDNVKIWRFMRRGWSYRAVILGKNLFDEVKVRLEPFDTPLRAVISRNAETKLNGSR